MAEPEAAVKTPTEIVSIDKDKVWRMDADAFVPKPDGTIVIGGVTYPIYSWLDAEILDSFRIARLAGDIDAAESYEDRTRLSIEQVLILNRPAEKYGLPILTEALIRSTGPRHILVMTAMASSVQTGPTTAAAESESPSASPSPSPASAGSTGGGQESSSA